MNSPAKPPSSPSAEAAARLKRIRSLLDRSMLRDADQARRVLASLESRHRGRAASSGPRDHVGPGSRDSDPRTPRDFRDSDRSLPVTPRLLDDLAALASRLEASVALRDRRALRRPHPTYPRELPITARAAEIVEAIRSPRHRVVIISGETGCGKSTQIPKMCLEAGRGVSGLIGCTQPRRIAAVTIADRIAEELHEELGRSVGYKIRFQDRTARDGYIKIMTDGILLAETQGDRRLTDYDTIIIDEAHERSLNIDFLLGIMRRLIDDRPELKLIITSATLDTAKFSAAFRNAPVIEVSGRLFPVTVEYRPPDREDAEDRDYVDQAVEAVEYLRREKPPGDILVFMPTEQDILETRRILEGRKYPATAVLPLFSRLPAGQQRMVYTVTMPKIVVATNVAETSLTIPGIRYVVDTGVARIAQYQPGTRINSLPIAPVSRASADQRKGRCGRVREGLCVRLYSEAEYESRDEFTQPEILRSDLAEVILRMIDLGLGDPLAFPFIDRPASKTVRDGYETLVELGAVHKSRSEFKSGTQYSIPNCRGDREARGTLPNSEMSIVSPNSVSPNSWALTDRGRLMARMPLDPRVSRMLVEGARENCLPEVAVLAAALSQRDPRERPPDQARQADAVHAAFLHPDSDFLVLLNIWNRYHGDYEKLGSVAQKRKFCHDNFLSFPRMRDWAYLHDEIRAVLGEQRLMPAAAHRRRSPGDSNSEMSIVSPNLKLHADVSPVLYAAIHRSILAGFLSNIAVRKDDSGKGAGAKWARGTETAAPGPFSGKGSFTKNQYSAAKNREVTLWPGSVLSGKSAAWIVATEVVRTSRLFVRHAARIDPGWLEDLGGPLCKRAYSDAAWDRARGEVVAKERVSLFGLEIVRDRRVSYGRINPSEAHDIFVMSALVEGEVDDPPPFLIHNLDLRRKVEAMEEKLRRRDILVPEASIAGFYSERLPGIYDIRSLRKLIRDQGASGSRAAADGAGAAGSDSAAADAFLRLSEADLLNYNPDAASVSGFPDTVEVAGRPFRAVYKFAPGEDDDGVTLTVPASLLNAIPPERLEWGVAGNYKDKIAALIKGLPKRYRKLLVPVAEKAELIAAEMPRAPEEAPLARSVAEFVRRRFGADIPAREWALAEVPKYLRMRVAVTDPATGRVIDTGRDVELLRKKIGAADEAPSKIDSPAWREARRAWEKTGLTGWTFGDLPEKIAVGTSLSAYPALVVEEGADKEQDGVKSTQCQFSGGGRGNAGAPASVAKLAIRLFPTRAEAAAAHRLGVRFLLMRKFAKDLAFVGRYHKIPAEHERAALAFGGRAAVERAIEAALACDVFERDIRTEADFRACEAELGRTLFEKGHALTQTTVRILELNQAVRSELVRGARDLTSAQAARGGGGAAGAAGAAARPRKTISIHELDRFREPVVPAYFDEIARELDKLLPKDFLEVYAIDRVVRIPRQLEAMKMRLGRARLDPEKDKAKAAQAEPYEYALERFEAEIVGTRRAAGAAGPEPKTVNSGTQYSFPNFAAGKQINKSEIGIVSPNYEKRRAVEELRRMVEEFKISLFAPEIKTAFPISAVRLARKIKEIEAIV